MTEAERKALEEVRAMLAPLKVYTVERILGMGGAGYVLKVRHRVFGERAMKLVHPKLLRSRIIRSRFDTEARVMHELSHPNVVKVHDLGEVGGLPLHRDGLPRRRNPRGTRDQVRRHAAQAGGSSGHCDPPGSAGRA